MELDEQLESIYCCIAHRGLSIRQTADELGIPKSTVHLLIHRDLYKHSLFKYFQVQAVLDYNKECKIGRRVRSL